MVITMKNKPFFIPSNIELADRKTQSPIFRLSLPESDRVTIKRLEKSLGAITQDQKKKAVKKPKEKRSVTVHLPKVIGIAASAVLAYCLLKPDDDTKKQKP